MTDTVTAFGPNADLTSFSDTRRFEEKVIRSLPRAEWKTARWLRTYRQLLIIADIACVVAASIVGGTLRFGYLADRPDLGAYVIESVIIVAAWIACLHASGAYDVRHLGVGVEEAKRVLRGTTMTVGVVAAACYLMKLDLARGYVAISIPIGFFLLAMGRRMLRAHVARLRRAGQWTQRIVACGSVESVNELIRATLRARRAGLLVVGACVDNAAPEAQLVAGVPIVSTVQRVAAVARDLGADVVALGSTGLSSSTIREVAWSLEGSGCAMAMSPGLTEVAGPRVHMSPVEGLPLMWVEQPQFTGVTRVVKRIFDTVGACVVLLLLGPLFVVVAAAIRLETRGPILFRQRRVGRHGDIFEVLKFRSMHTDAEARRDEVMSRHDGDGALYKLKSDPRVTKVGALIRRYSIDELPQLLNVLAGHMSLVGPRPLAAIDSDYGGNARRRLLVTPGMTGLWQVSGRSNLSWDDAVRLDLYYVENWSLALDATIIAKTVRAVLRSDGAY